ncbi:MAG: hypothetical protein ACPLYF_03360 [Fervidobacterium sp.]
MPKNYDIQKPKKANYEPKLDINSQVKTDFLTPDATQQAMIDGVNLTAEIQTVKIRKKRG